jgi:hypothetical protein
MVMFRELYDFGADLSGDNGFKVFIFLFILIKKVNREFIFLVNFPDIFGNFDLYFFSRDLEFFKDFTKMFKKIINI